MAEQTRTTLKTYFNTGDKPTESQFADLIDSFVNRTDDAVAVSGVIKLGSLTAAVLNAGPAATTAILSLSDVTNLPAGYYIERFGFDITEQFQSAGDAGSTFQPYNTNVIAGGYFFNSVDLLDNLELLISETKVLTPVNILGYFSPATPQAIDVFVNFDIGGGEVNPKDYTAGNIDIYAFTKPFFF